MSRASTATILPLDRFASILGINPAHFNQANLDTRMPATSTCDDVWFQWGWQSGDKASREDVGQAIMEAEAEIAHALGYPPGPIWIDDEVHRFPRHHRPEVTQFGGLNVHNQRKSIHAKWGKVIEPGRRATSSVGTATTAGGTLTYTDADGDGEIETATITLTTTLTNECEIKAYFPGYSQVPEWEIRPHRTKSISGGSVTMTFWTWQLILPSLWEEFTSSTSTLSSIDASNTANLLTSVEVYREYTDNTQASCQLFWEPRPRNILIIASCDTCSGSGCEACSFTTQNGCLHVRDNDSGLVVPQPATYDASTDTWSQVAFSVCRDPDLVKIWYRAGDLAQPYLRDRQNCYELSNRMAQAITWLAVARLNRPVCDCSSRVTKALQEDLALTNNTRSYQLGFRALDNPFGTRRGEVQAWQRIQHLAEHSEFGAAI